MASAAVPDARRSMTADELLGLPDDGRRHELVNGELRAMTPAGYGQGLVSAHIVRVLGNAVEDGNLGEVLTSETGFVLARSPDTVRAPDAAFVSASRVPADDDLAGFSAVVPDLVVEVVSPSDRAAEVNAKAIAWLEAGVRLVWVVDTETRIVVVHRSGLVAQILREGQVLEGEDVVPGFALPLARLFRRSGRPA